MFNLPGFCVRPGLSTEIVMRSRDEVKKRIGFDLTKEEYFGMQHLLSYGKVNEDFLLTHLAHLGWQKSVLLRELMDSAFHGMVKTMQQQGSNDALGTLLMDVSRGEPVSANRIFEVVSFHLGRDFVVLYKKAHGMPLSADDAEYLHSMPSVLVEDKF